MKTKTPKESFTKMTELVLPNDTNTLGNLMGGRLMHWMDIVAATTCYRHTNRVCVTVSADQISFEKAIKLGEIVILEAKVTRAFTTSMEVRIDVYAENLFSGEVRHSNSAYFSFVAVDQNGNTIPVNPLEPETQHEKEEFEGALKRRELRLFLSGKIKAADCTALQEMMKK